MARPHLLARHRAVLLLILLLLGTCFVVGSASGLVLEEKKVNWTEGKTYTYQFTYFNDRDHDINVTFDINTDLANDITINYTRTFDPSGEYPKKGPFFTLDDQTVVPRDQRVVFFINFHVPTESDGAPSIDEFILTMIVDDNPERQVGFQPNVIDTEPEPSTIKFLIAIAPLIIVLIGILTFRKSGLFMAIAGWMVAVFLAVAYFKTPLEVALGASIYGFIKAFGISIAVIATMYMIFLMKELGLLGTISNGVKDLVKGKENQALFVGVGFGSFLTCLGVVTPSMFPPLLVAMGFSPFAAVSIAVLGYNATTSFALLSIPVTIPADAFGLDVVTFSLKISLFLPVISVGFAMAILYILGGVEAKEKGGKMMEGGIASLKKGFIPAIICGLVTAIACILFLGIDYMAGAEIIPVEIVGILAGVLCMVSIWLYAKLTTKEEKPKSRKKDEDSMDHGKVKKKRKIEDDAPADAIHAPSLLNKDFLLACSPWIVLMGLATFSSLGPVNEFLADVLGNFEVLYIFDQKIDLNIFTNIYFWIIVSVLITMIIFRVNGKLTKKVFTNTNEMWKKRIWGPFIAYSIYFSIAYVMFWSARELVGGNLVASPDYYAFNMNLAVGTFLAQMGFFPYLLVGASGLGLFGAVVGGSETGSNMMFYGIQKAAAKGIELNDNQFLTMYSGHAVAGGIASAITPAKINNAVATLGEKAEMESKVMKVHLGVVLLLGAACGIMLLLFVMFLGF